MFKFRKTFGLVLFLTSFQLSLHAKAAEIISVFPTGSVKQVQQVVVKFSTDMVALGDPRSFHDPMNVTCVTGRKKTSPSFKTRWVDTKAWSLDFDHALASGTQCKLVLAEIKDLKGDRVVSKESYSFSTGGPAILSISPQYGEIEPEQYFLVQTDGAIDVKSVESLGYFEAETIPDRIGVVVLKSEQQREEIIRAEVAHQWRWNELRPYLKIKKPIAQIPEFKNFIVLKANRRFPEDHQISLHWPQGILSPSGVAVSEAQTFEFRTRLPFSVQMTCERVAPGRPCNPIQNIRLQFTSRISIKALQNVKIVSDKKQVFEPLEIQSGDSNENSSGAIRTHRKSRVSYRVIRNFNDDEVDTLTFSAPFPERSKFKVMIPKGIKDELGRALVNEDKFPLDIETDEYLPLIKFSGAFGLLELKAEPALPVSVRNIEKQMLGSEKTIEGRSLALTSSSKAKDVIDWYNKVLRKEDAYNERNIPLLQPADGQNISLPKPLGERDFELVGIPFKKPGFYVVELQSPKLGQALLGAGTMYVASSALVTNLSVHFKKGRESSLVWVTSLDSAKPVKDAEVGIYDGEGNLLSKSKTDASGIAKFGTVNYPCGFQLQTDDDHDQGSHHQYGRACEVYAFAKKDEDFSFVSSQWAKGIEEYRFNLSREYLAPRWGPAIAHTILDRSLFRAGETVRMKHILREYGSEALRGLNPKALPKRVLIRHNGTQKTFTLPFHFISASGTALNDFAIPKDAPLGTYSIFLSNKKDAPKQKEDGDEIYDYTSKSTGEFTVSEFRLPLMQANVKIQGDHLIQPKEVKADLSASYLSGGPAAGLFVKLRSIITPGYFTPEIAGGSDYTFFSDPVKTGLVDAEAGIDHDEQNLLKVQDLKLRPDGGVLAVIGHFPKIQKISKLKIEMEFRDPNGETKTASADKDLFPSEYIVGLRSDNWIASPGKVSAAGVITSPSGKALAGIHYSVEAFGVNNITHRKKLVGGFYSYDSKTETLALGQVCDGKSDSLGRFTCNAKKLPAGRVILQAKVTDHEARSSFASISMDVFESGSESWWAPSDSDRIDLIPEKNRYEPGETAKFVVRSPFPTSTVLVTVEREGILESFVREVKRDQSVIEVPIKDQYAPNVFVSALAIRGRVGVVQPTALIDLGKPAMKLGAAELRVDWKSHELKVNVLSNQKKYHTRDKAEIRIQVRTASGAILPAGAEVAIAAVDEALLHLKQNKSWNILEAMMGQRPLAVDTSSSQNQIIGKRHFGAKAKAPGGGGGGSMSGDVRELFDSLLLWEPSLKLNEKGEAVIKVPLNDSITSFHIEAIAQAGLNLFGNAHTEIQSTKDLILYSGFAPLARDGDFIHNTLTLRNTTAQAMNIALKISSPDIQNMPMLKDVRLAASEAKTIEINLTVPKVKKDLEFLIQASDKMSAAKDNLKFKVKIQESLPPRVLQATLFQVDKMSKLPVQQPKDAVVNSGGLDFQASDSLLASLAGVKSYMEEYPYSCLEQKVSQAITAEDKKSTEAIIQALPSYLDSQGLLKFFPSSICGSAQLTRYVNQILAANSYQIPYATKTRMIEGMKSYLNNGESCHSWWDSFVRNIYRDQERILVMSLLSDLKSFDVSSLTSVQVTPNLWKTETLVAWYHLLKNETMLTNREALLKQAENILRSRVNYQGSLMNLQGDLDWEAQWHLFSSRDQEALQVFGLAVEEPSWASDIGKMARGVTARLRRGIWDSTMANAWGVTALRKFSAKFEKDRVQGSTIISASQKPVLSFDWAKSAHGDFKKAAWPASSSASPVEVSLTHQGQGKPWILMRTESAIPLKSPMEFGYKISRKVSPVTQKVPGKWSLGDVANVEIVVESKADQAWVVVRDPIPAGASHLGTGLSGNSEILDKRSKKSSDPVGIEPWPTEFEEKSQSHFISYAAYLQKGRYVLNYRIRLNSAGEFKLPTSKVEAMYAPESFGESPNANWSVAP